MFSALLILIENQRKAYIRGEGVSKFKSNDITKLKLSRNSALVKSWFVSVVDICTIILAHHEKNCTFYQQQKTARNCS